MRQLNVSCLLCRHIGLSAYPRLGTSHLARTPVRASSLSAIHRGLRDSEKARPQGFRPGALETAPRQAKRSSSRTSAGSWEKPGFKLKKGKKDITEGPPKGPSRRARFNDPNSSFGKKSLVFQAKQLGSFGSQGSKPERNAAVSKDDFERAFHGPGGQTEPSRRPDRDSSSSQRQSRPGENRSENRFSRDQPQVNREGRFETRSGDRFEDQFKSRSENQFSRDKPQARRENTWQDRPSESRSNTRPGNRFEGRSDTRSENRTEKRFDDQFSKNKPRTIGTMGGRSYQPNQFQSRSAGRFEDRGAPRKEFGDRSATRSNDQRENKFESRFSRDKPQSQRESTYQERPRFENRFDSRSSADRPPVKREGTYQEAYSKSRFEDRSENRSDTRSFTDTPPVKREGTYQGAYSKPQFEDRFEKRSDTRSFTDTPPVKREDTYQGAYPKPRFEDRSENRSDTRPFTDTPPVKREDTYQDFRRVSPDTERPRNQDKDDGPIRIHHTTAVSQFLYGRSVVEAAMKSSRRRLYRLYLYTGDDRQDLSLSQDIELMRIAKNIGVRVIKVTKGELRMLNEMSGGRPHNGCVLEASPLPQLPLKSLGPLSQDPDDPDAPETPGEQWFAVERTHQSREEADINGETDRITYQLPRHRKPFVLLLDGILDPGNLGAILRSAAFLGANAVAITKHSSATLTAVALKASAGASEVLTLFSVQSAADFLTRSKESGWLVYAAVPSSGRSRGNTHLTVDRVESYDPLATRPTVLVVGSEGEGLDKKVRRAADMEVSIPSPSGLHRTVDSLNVSVATGILCAAFLKKQQSGFEIEESVPATEEEDGLW